MSKQKYFDIQPVPGVIYYFKVKGFRRVLYCASVSEKKVKLHDMTNGYPIEWYLSHFSYMVRTAMWQPPSYPDRTREIIVKVVEGVRRAGYLHNYTQEQLNALIDDIEDVDFGKAERRNEREKEEVSSFPGEETLAFADVF